MTKITQIFYQTKRGSSKWFLSLFVLLLMSSQMSWGQATLPFYDGLNYTVGSQLYSGTNWGYNGAAAATNDTPIVSGSISFTGLAASTGNKTAFVAGGDESTKSFTSTSGAGTTVYFSYLMNITDITGFSSGYNVGMINAASLALTTTAPGSGSIVGPVWIKTGGVANTFNIGFSGRANQTTVGTTPTSLIYDTVNRPIGTPVLVVVSITFVTGTANDIYKVWINPLPGAGEPTPSIVPTTVGPNFTSSTDISDVAALLIRQNNVGGTPSTELDEFRVGLNWASVTPASTTWDGLTWSNSDPSSTKEAIIAGTYNGPAFDAKKVTVNSGSMTITSGTMTLQNEVINNAGANGIVFENNANLVQVNPVANTGNVVVKRNSSPLLLFDYTLWSSPVAGQNLAAFSPLTSLSPNRFYVYDSASDKYTNTVPVTLDPTTTNFTPGAGYLIRMPNTADAGTPTAYPGVFTGVPNNGNVPFTLSTAGGGYNLVGNPYPSPINMTQFVNDNTATITGTLYFWRKTNGSGTAYCTWAPAVSPPTGTFVTNGNLQSVDPLGVLQTGQGFFVQANNSGSITFKNGQRAANTAGQFFKTKQPATSSRIWLNATNTAGDFSQMAVTYFDGASQGVDIYDGKYINDSTFALTSNINGGEYTIQGRPAFDASDVVSLNFKTDVSGNYTIAIDHTDGLFASGQEVYLIDNKTGTETNLNTSSHTFTAAAGIDNTRFSLKYQKTLKVDAAAFNDNSVAVYKSNGTLYVNSALKAIDSIRVYDVQGRLIAEQNKVKANTATISNLKVNNQVLIVKVTGEDNSEVTKKVLN